MKVAELWIGHEECEKPTGWDPADDNTDVIATLEDGSRWVATFFSYANIWTLAEKNKRTGECLGGRYFWATDMVLVDEVSRTRIEEVVEHLVAEDEFQPPFCRVS